MVNAPIAIVVTSINSARTSVTGWLVTGGSIMTMSRVTEPITALDPCEINPDNKIDQSLLEQASSQAHAQVRANLAVPGYRCLFRKAQLGNQLLREVRGALNVRNTTKGHQLNLGLYDPEFDFTILGLNEVEFRVTVYCMKDLHFFDDLLGSAWDISYADLQRYVTKLTLKVNKHGVLSGLLKTAVNTGGFIERSQPYRLQLQLHSKRTCDEFGAEPGESSGTGLE